MTIVGGKAIFGGMRSCLQLDGSCNQLDGSHSRLAGSHCGLDERIFGWVIDCESIFGEVILGGTIGGVAIVGEVIVRGDGAVATRHLAAHGGRDKHLIFSV